MIKKAIRRQINAPSVSRDPYRRLLNIMAERTLDQGHHTLITTNWDYLLQREVDAWIEANQPGVAPRFLSAESMVYHLNGSAQPGNFPNRSPFMLETDCATIRHEAFEADKAFDLMLWSKLVVIVGMSFECNTDRGLLGALRTFEDYMPIGSARFIVVDPCHETLDGSFSTLTGCFPLAKVLRVNMGLAEWIDAGMLELVEHIFCPAP